jgi:peptidoglycan/LPS O-acetylase OafA/YrhL
VLAALAAASVIAATGSDFAHALTYTVNYDPRRSWDVGHLWSLAVEEQFYLIWPATVAWIGVRRAWRPAALAVVLVPMIRVVEASFWPNRIQLIGLTFETTADAIALGCLLALVREELFGMSWYRRAVESRWIPPAVLLLGVVASLRYRPGLLIGQSLIDVAILVTIDRCVRRPDGLLGRVLNARPLVFVGTLSYSIYLWQQLFLDRASSAPLCAFPLNLMLAAACALASYYLVERPALRARRHVERVVLGDR